MVFSDVFHIFETQKTSKLDQLEWQKCGSIITTCAMIYQSMRGRLTDLYFRGKYASSADSTRQRDELESRYICIASKLNLIDD